MGVKFYGDDYVGLKRVNWETTNWPTFTNLFTSVAYGCDKFVAISQAGKFMYSQDGRTWSTTLVASSEWESVTYGYNKFIAVSLDGKIAYSYDGINWEINTSIAVSGLKKVTYGAGKFVAVAQNTSSYIYSTDGLSWTIATLPSSGYWWSLAYGAGKFVALRYASNYGAYSTDGINWTQIQTPDDTNLWVALSYGDEKFMAFAYSNQLDYNKIGIFSADGINWSIVTLPTGGQWNSSTYGAGYFVVCTTNQNFIIYSHNGIDWTISFVSTYIKDAIAYGQGKFIMRNLIADFSSIPIT